MRPQGELSTAGSVGDQVLNGHAHKLEKPAADNGCINNNNLSEMDGHLRRRSQGGQRHLSPVRRELSPLRHVGDSWNRNDVLLDQWQDKLKILCSTAQVAENHIHELQNSLKCLLRDSQHAHISSSTSPDSTNERRSSGHEEKSKTEKKKVFITRDSVLTQLFSSSHHISTVYHLAVVVLIVLVLNTIVSDISSTGSVRLGLALIWHAFGGFHRVITIWLVMFLSMCVMYASFGYWAERRLMFSGVVRRCIDSFALALLVLYYTALIAFPVHRMQMYDMKIASTFALCTESVRLLMKAHAFVRSNVPRALSANKPLYPGFSQFLYFMFAPTLIYSDSYPRTKMIRWRVVACHGLEVVGVIFYLSFLCERYLLPLYRLYGTEPPSVLKTLEIITAGVLPSGLTFVCSFYLLLHSWQNAFAEMLCFGDRQYYQDWWNTTTFADFYRKWNILVQDWLFCYVYQDARHMKLNPFASKMSVFVISAVFHEFILSFTFGFFFPVLYIMFGIIGTMFGFMRYRHPSQAVGNIFLWFSLFAGSGMLFGLYSIEFYARQNCVRFENSSWDLFVPRSLNCQPA